MIFYHGTIAARLASIKAKGLIPRAAPGGDAWAKQSPNWRQGDLLQNPSRDNSVFLTPNPVMALWFANMAADLNGDKPVVLEVKLPEPLAQETIIDEESGNGPIHGRRFVGIVSPDLISVMPSNEQAQLPRFPI